jgi:PAS domain S-box-containing protein
MAEQWYCLTAEETRVLEALPTAMGIFQFRKGMNHLLLLTDGLCRLMHCERETILAEEDRDFTAFIHHDDRKALRDAKQFSLLHPDEEYQFFCRLRTGTEKYRRFSVRGQSRILPDRSSLIYFYLSEVTEITTQDLKLQNIQRNKMLKEILDTTQTAIFWKDTDRRFLGVNRAFLEYYGFKNEKELIGKNDEEVGWHTDPEQYKNDELEVLQKGIRTHRVPGKCMARGENRDITASKSPIYENGKIVGLVGSFEDVTTELGQRREIDRLNAELKKRVDEYDMLMKSSGVGIIKLRMGQDLSVEECNDTAYRILGITKQELAERFRSASAAEQGEDGPDELLQLRQKAEDALQKKHSSIAFTMKLPKKKSFVWINGVGTFTDYDRQTRRPARLFAVFRDITDVVRSQEKLRAAKLREERSKLLESENARLNRILGNLPAGILTVAIQNGTPVRMFVNNHLAKYLGIQYGVAAIDSFERFLVYIHPEERERVRADLGALLQDRKSSGSNMRIRNMQTGKYVWVHVEGRLHREKTGEDYLYLAYTDIDALMNAEAELRDSRRIYAATVRAAQLVMWEYDIPAHRIIMSDDPYTTVDFLKFGMSRYTENVPMSVADYIDENDVPAFLEMYRKVEAGQDATCDVWYKTRPGVEARCERITYTVMHDSDGNAVRAYGMGRNITAEKKVEERYEREMNTLRQTRDFALLFKSHCDLTSNEILEYDTKDPELFSARTDETYDHTLEKFLCQTLSPADRKALTDRLDRKKMLRRYQQGEMQSAIQYRASVPDSAPVWIRLAIHTYMMPQTGDIECFLYAYDVTQKVLEEQIITQLANLGYDEIGLIYVRTGSCRMYRMNGTGGEALTDTADYEKEVLEQIRRRLPEEQQEETLRMLRISSVVKELQKETGFSLSCGLHGSGGALRQKLFQMSYLDSAKDTIFFCMSDITKQTEHERQQIEILAAARKEAVAANEAKSDFLSGMSHDLRTPLNGVIGFTELAMKEENPDRMRDYLSKIRLSGKLLLDLVNDTLDLSRIESGKLTLEPEAVSSRAMLEEVVTALRPSADMKNVTLDADPLTFPQDTVWADRLKVQKIVLNLLSNAIKYTPSGGTVTMNVTRLDPPDNGRTHRLVVRDNGIGMSTAFIERIYDPFSQEHRKEAQGITGTGLGMTLVKRYVELMNGTIRVESHVGKGTAFTVDLPLQEVSAAKAEQKAVRTAEKNLTGKQVLLCEDNMINEEIAAVLLQEKGMKVDWAKDGSEGLSMFRESKPGYYDLILMDIQMPVMDGLTATREIRALHRPDAADIPIIAMTARAFAEDVKKCLDAGMNAHVAKPIEPEQMFRVLADSFPKG